MKACFIVTYIRNERNKEEAKETEIMNEKEHTDGGASDQI
jgi:hypothetical protein